MKKNVYKVYIYQTFDYTVEETKWFKKNKIVKQCNSKGQERLILAENEDTAIQIYKDRYKIDYDDLADYNGWYQYRWGSLDNFKNEVRAYEVRCTFDYLKKHLKADEFLEYCKQELYPIEVIMKD